MTGVLIESQDISKQLVFDPPKARNNISNLKESVTLATANNQRNKKLIWKAGFGESAFPCPQTLCQTIKAESHQNHYSPTTGLPELKKNISYFYQYHFNLSLKADNFFIFPGSKMAFFSLGAILKPSYFLTPKASWVSYEPQALINNHIPIWLETEASNSYKLTADTLEKYLIKLIQSSQKSPPLLFLNSPNNPTGAVYNQQ